MKKIITLQPFVLTNIKKNNVILYNTLNGKKIVTSANRNVDFVKMMESNLRVLEINNYKSISSKFMEELLSNHMVDILYQYNEIFPVQIPPIPKVDELNDIDLKNKNNKGSIIHYLNEVTFTLNSSEKNYLLANGYKQFLYNVYSSSNSELKLNIILETIKNINCKRLKFNFIGGNIFEYSAFSTLLKKLPNSNFKINFYFYYLDIFFKKKLRKNFIELIKNSYQAGINLNINFHAPYDFKLIGQIYKYLNLQNVYLKFIVSSEDELNSFETLIEKFNDLNCYSLLPYYNGKNLNFFKKHVFINENDIFYKNFSRFDIFKNHIINENFFGKLYILNNGDTYANLNKMRLGNINKEKLSKIINNELKKNTCWKISRDQIEPCKNCIYSIFCPPLSNYEFNLKLNNLCNLKNNQL